MAAVFAMFAGPPVAGILLTVLASEKADIREQNSRLLNSRVAARLAIRSRQPIAATD
jgi:hypothetical protein